MEYGYSGAQIVVVSVEYLDGLYADEYALQLMNDWGVGSATKNNGMLLLFSTKENKGWLATGDGIDNAFTDEIANEYMNKYFWKEYDKGNYDKAVNTLFTKLEKWYQKHHDDVIYFNKTTVEDSYWFEYIIFFGLIIGIGVFFKVQDIKRRDTYDPSYLTDLYNGTLNSTEHTSTSHHSHHRRSYRSSSSSRSYGSSSRSSRSHSGRGGGGRSGGGGGGRR